MRYIEKREGSGACGVSTTHAPDGDVHSLRTEPSGRRKLWLAELKTMGFRSILAYRGTNIWERRISAAEYHEIQNYQKQKRALE